MQQTCSQNCDSSIRLRESIVGLFCCWAASDAGLYQLALSASQLLGTGYALDLQSEELTLNVRTHALLSTVLVSARRLTVISSPFTHELTAFCTFSCKWHLCLKHSHFFPTSHPGITVELTLLAVIQASWHWGHESSRADLTPHLPCHGMGEGKMPFPHTSCYLRKVGALAPGSRENQSYPSSVTAHRRADPTARWGSTLELNLLSGFMKTNPESMNIYLSQLCVEKATLSPLTFFCNFVKRSVGPLCQGL